MHSASLHKTNNQYFRVRLQGTSVAVASRQLQEIGGKIMQALPYINNCNVAFGKCSLDSYTSFDSQSRGDRARSLADLDVHLGRG